MTETMTSGEGTDETCATPKPEKEHDWLHRLIGDWDFADECFMGTDQPPMKSTGEFTVRSLGGLWVLCEGISDALDGTPVPSIITLGYDPQKMPLRWQLCRRLHDTSLNL
jgi:hypothetical protein